MNCPNLNKKLVATNNKLLMGVQIWKSTIEHLRDFYGSFHFIQAYLMYQAIIRLVEVNAGSKDFGTLGEIRTHLYIFVSLKKNKLLANFVKKIMRTGRIFFFLKKNIIYIIER
jgi:hypothetical protein